MLTHLHSGDSGEQAGMFAHEIECSKISPTIYHHYSTNVSTLLLSTPLPYCFRIGPAVCGRLVPVETGWSAWT